VLMLPSLPAQAILLFVALNFAPIAIAFVFRVTAERAWPAETLRKSSIETNYFAYFVLFFTTTMSAPLLNALTVYLANRLGSGVIVLPSNGLWLVAGFLVFAVSQDLVEYLFHRAEHVVPILWSMHSLHHSDTKLDASTSFLHHWMIALIHAVCVGVPVALLFKVPPIDLWLWTLISNHVFLMHANLRWDFGPLSWLITSPRYHRVHHSAVPEHFGSNFASILPIWDVLFDTRHKEWRLGDSPAVGLGGDKPSGLFDLMFWPIRDQLRHAVPRHLRTPPI
jgi:sterol desaturase/sphingolipid hydroxylase (fatty acid hydroxylase superfamily)